MIYLQGTLAKGHLSRIKRVGEENQMDIIADRITINPEQCGGRPCIRGMRIRVSDVLDLLANGLSIEQIVDELPDLEPADVVACLHFASRLTNPETAA